ncbi:hypothetical protein [Rhodoferax antarcticus]|uniref:hypothetical protein n=1 Tax=Rhodoferax antarcticus TaxID=81479 RepID=UPI000ACA92C0|nr:hypothetical protein [Rhodoferax antarcticus]
MSNIEHYTGYIIVKGVRIQADFELPKGSTKEQQDSAFVGALAQEIELNYLVLGEYEKE